MNPLRPAHCGASFLFVGLLFVSGGCDKLEKPVKSDDATSVVHEGNRVTVRAKSPLASRLEVEPARMTTIRRQVTAPASVEADPARYARILPPLNGRVLGGQPELPAPKSQRSASCGCSRRGSSIPPRAHVISKARALKATELRIELAKTNLIPDMNFGGAFTHTGVGSGDFLQPVDNVLSFGLSVNLPVSRLRYQGEVEAARAARAQAELQLGAVQLRVETEVRTAYSRYQASVQRLELYRSGMLKNADRVLDARLYAYQRGGATLLEVIDAERTSADVYLSYSQALVEHAHALVALEQTAGIWDVTF